MVQSVRVTQKIVFDAADKLERKGIKPTARGLLEIIGNGSLTTHQKYLREWQELQGIEETVLFKSVTRVSSSNALQFNVAIEQCWQDGYEAGVASRQDEIAHLTELLEQARDENKQLHVNDKATRSTPNSLTEKRSESKNSGQVLYL